MDWLVYIFYGFVSGLGELVPVSNVAHDYFLRLMTNVQLDQPLLQLCIHAASLGALVMLCWHRGFHVYREMRIAAQPARRRKRQPDLMAVMDGRMVMTMFIPAVVGVLATGLVQKQFSSLPAVVLFLILSGILIYVPHYLPGANRDSRHLSRLEGICFGICAGFAALPGFSRLGGLLSVGGLRGCSRRYMLDIALLLMIPLLAVMVALDLFALLTGGIAAISFVYFMQCLFSAAAAFGGTCLAIAAMRFISVNMGYTIFAYYNWGLGIFGFILYLMI